MTKHKFSNNKVGTQTKKSPYLWYYRTMYWRGLVYATGQEKETQNNWERENKNVIIELLSDYPPTTTTTTTTTKSLQSCPTLCDPIDGSPPGSAIPGILQARTLEWGAISFSSTWKWKVKVKSLSRVGLLATPWTVAYQAPLSMGFSRQEYWSGVPLPSPTHLVKSNTKNWKNC